MAIRAEWDGAHISAPGFGFAAARVDLERDRELVLRYQAGDERAFDELYRRYFDRLHAYCARRVHDRHSAEELAQEAFLRALRAMPRFAGDRRFYPWMTVIAQRLCIDFHRRSSRVDLHAEVDTGAVDADHDELFAAVDRDHLTAAVGRLAPRHREVLALREEKGWSYQQIAAHLDVPVSTVEALLHRARKALRREFTAVTHANGRLAAIPLVGWAVLHVARAKAKLAAIGQQIGQVALPAAAGVAALGVVVAPIAANRHEAHHPGQVATAAPTIHRSLDRIEPTAGAATGAASPADTVAVAGGESLSKAAPDAALTIGSPNNKLYMGEDGAAYAYDEARDLPVAVTVGPVAVGADPEKIVDDVVAGLKRGLK